MDESFLDLLSKCQGERLDDQRSEFPSPVTPHHQHSNRDSRTSELSNEDDDLFDALWKLQSSRIEEQRCDFPAGKASPSSAATSNSAHRWQQDEEVSSDELFELIFTAQVSGQQCSVLASLQTPRCSHVSI